MQYTMQTVLKFSKLILTFILKLLLNTFHANSSSNNGVFAYMGFYVPNTISVRYYPFFITK